MSRFENEQKAREEYGNCRLRYKLQPGDDTCWELNRKNYEKMKEALAAVGVWFDVEEDELRLTIYPEGYIRAKERNAGRRKAAAWKQEKLDMGEYELYQYSDIVFMMQTKKDADVAAEIRMPIATFYRHKKAMKESAYYKSLDLNRLRDKEYLESVAGNRMF